MIKEFFNSYKLIPSPLYPKSKRPAVGFKRVGEVYQGSCPSCRSSDAFTYWPRTSSWHCFSCGYHPKLGNVNQLIVKKAEKTQEKEREKKKQRADPDLLHNVYAELLRHLSLSQEHKAHLLNERQFTESEIIRRSYKTLPRKGRARIAKRLLNRFGIEVLNRVPGFYAVNAKRENQYLSIAGASGIVLPVRDIKGRIIALQIKADEPSGGKYKWLSSSGKPCGTESGAPAHLSKPNKKTSGTLFITEGVLKADMASNLLNAEVISISGVGNWRSGGVIEMVKKLKPEVIAIAYDSDAETNQNVYRQRETLCNALQSLGLSIFIAKWNLTQGKGLDDLLLNGGKPDLEPRRRKGKRFQAIPSELLKEAEQPQYLSLEEVRETLYRKMMEIFSKAKPGVNIISSSIGSGKTRAALQVVYDLHRKGEWPLTWRTKKGRKEPRPARVLFVTDSKAAYEQWLPMFKDLAEVREGRAPDPNSKWYCPEYELACQLGENRHSPHWDLCQDCKHRHGEEWFCPYLESVEKTKVAKLVFAPKNSFFNHSSELRDFDIVIVDEDMLKPLWEQPTLTIDQLNHYLQGMTKIKEQTPQAYSSNDPFVKMIHLLKSLISGSEVRKQSWAQAIPKLREVAKSEGVNLEELVETLNQIPPNKKTKRYLFERPYYSKDGWIVPLRFFWDLITALKAEASGRVDTRLWLTTEGLKLYLPKQHIINLLKGKGRRKGKCVINLDATPSPLLDYMFPKAEKFEIKVKESMEVTQATDGLYPKDTLSARKSLDNMKKAVEKAIEGSDSPVVFTHKLFDPQVEDGNPKLKPEHPNIRFGHFDYETRALNGYSDADCMVVVGHYCHPLNEIKAMAQALRFAEHPETSDPHPSEELRQYQFKSPQGIGAGFWHKRDPDPLVQNCINHSEESAIKQAIGRGRPALRSEDNPLRVHLFTATPVEELTISQFTTVKEILSKKGQSVNFEASRTSINKQREIEAKEKIKSAIKELREKGQEASIRKIHNLTGCSFSTIEKAISTLDPPPVTDCMQDINNISRSVTPPLTGSKNNLLREEIWNLWRQKGRPVVAMVGFGVFETPDEAEKGSFAQQKSYKETLESLPFPRSSGTNTKEFQSPTNEGNAKMTKDGLKNKKHEEFLEEAINLWEQKGRPPVMTNKFGLVRDPRRPVFSLSEVQDYLRCLRAQYGQ